MADSIELDPGTGGAIVSTEEITTLNGGAVSAEHVQRMLLAYRSANGAAIDLTVGGGVEAAALRVTIASDSTGVLSVDDNGGSLTVDGTVEIGATSLAALESITVVDGGASLTVDNGGTFAVQADTELTTADLDTGGGTDTRAVVGLALAASGGAVLAGTANPLPVSDNGGSITVDGTVTANLGTAAVTNAGTFAVQDSEKIADDAAFTVGTTKVQPVGYLADQASTDSVNEGDIGAARMTLDRKQIVTPAPSADTEGLDTFRSADMDETEEDVKASAGKLYGWAVYNDGAAEVFLQFWNATAANTTPGTTTPRLTFPIPAGAAANIEFTNGIAFDTAICVGATTGFGDAGAPAAAQVSGTVFYK